MDYGGHGADGCIGHHGLGDAMDGSPRVFETQPCIAQAAKGDRQEMDPRVSRSTMTIIPIPSGIHHPTSHGHRFHGCISLYVIPYIPYPSITGCVVILYRDMPVFPYAYPIAICLFYEGKCLFVGLHGLLGVCPVVSHGIAGVGVVLGVGFRVFVLVFYGVGAGVGFGVVEACRLGGLVGRISAGEGTPWAWCTFGGFG